MNSAWKNFLQSNTALAWLFFLFYLAILDNNKIKTLNDRLFDGCSKLTTLYLRGNRCIQEDFLTTARIAELPQVITEKCSTVEDSVLGEGSCHSSLMAAKTENERINAELNDKKEIIKKLEEKIEIMSRNIYWTLSFMQKRNLLEKIL